MDGQNPPGWMGEVLYKPSTGAEFHPSTVGQAFFMTRSAKLCDLPEYIQSPTFGLYFWGARLNQVFLVDVLLFFFLVVN